MKGLKDLLKLKPTENHKDSKTDEEKSDEQIKQTLKDKAKAECLEASGSPDILRNCLESVFENFKEASRIEDAVQEEIKAPIREEKERQTTEKEKRKVLKEIREASIDDISNQIKKIEQSIAEVPQNPSKYGVKATKKPRAQFYIGLLILVPITLYLIVFYISASYSAFFKEFSPETTVFAAIFDGQAISKAYTDTNGGLLEVVFVCTIPFAFMGLGYLIHMFQKGKGLINIKIISLFLVTFLFDAILAYQIENKIFDFEKLPGEVFNLSLAIQSAQFWGIVFAGFVVYIIWGLVFDFVMNEYENIDKIKIFIRSLKEKKDNLVEERIKLKKQKNEIDKDIVAINGHIKELQAKIDSFVFQRKRYLKHHREYLSGWLLTLSNDISMAHQKKEHRIKECNTVSDTFLEDKKVSNSHPEIVTYYEN